MTPRLAVRAIETCFRARQPVFIKGSPGVGKCLGRGTGVLMYDGTVRAVEEVQTGDQLMGPDSTPRTVVGTTHGIGPLYTVKPKKGDPYTVNAHHVLSLRKTFKINKRGRRKGGEVVNIPVTDYINNTHSFKHRHKGWRTGVEFQAKPVDIDPYFLGLWLGDGHSNEPAITKADVEIKDFVAAFAVSSGTGLRSYDHNNATTMTLTTGKTGRKPTNNPVTRAMQGYDLINNKHVPQVYLSNDRATRIELLAGLMDSDGSLCHDRVTFEISTKFVNLAKDILFLARSLGFAAYNKPAEKSCQTGATGIYQRITISGETNAIPTRVARKQANKRKQKKSVLVTGIEVIAAGIGDFFGFELDGDHLFLLDDFTVTHNSMLVMQIAEKMDWDLRDIRAVQMDPVDIRGLPYVSADKRSHWAVPEFFPNDGQGVFFVDELTSAPQMVQAAFYQLVLDRKLGEYRLPDGWVIAAAGNKETDRGVTFRMPTPLRNRFTHIELEPSLEDWLIWAEKASIRPEIMSFLKFDSGALCQFEKDQDAFSTPRTWHFLSKILDAEPEAGETEYSLISGTVGPASAAKFKAHLKMFRDLPTYDQIIRSPDKTKIPTTGSAQYAVALMISRKLEPKTIGNAAEYVARLAPELGVMVYKTAFDRDDNIGKTKEFINFAVDHKIELMGVAG